MRLSRLSAGIVAVSLAVASCGGGSGSSDTTERTRNSAVVSPFANMAMFISGDTAAGLTKIYQYVFNSAGVPTVTEVYSATADGNTGVVGVSYDASSNKVYWAMQESSGIRIKSAIPGTSEVETLYSIAGGYPYNFSHDRRYGSLLWNGRTRTENVWAGNDNGSPVVIVRSSATRSLSAGRNSAVFNMSNSFYEFPLNLASPSVVEGSTSKLGWTHALDSDNRLIYYTTEDASGSTNLVKAVPGAADVPVTLLTTPKRIRTIAVKSDGSLFYADGPRPSLGDSLTASTITWLNPSDPTTTQTITPDPNLSITSIWIVEAPETITDPWIDGDLTMNSEHECNFGDWKDDNGGTRSSHYLQSGTQDYKWYLNGDLVSEGSNETYTPTAPGRLKCVVTVNNLVGIATASSIEFDVIDPTATTTTTIESSGSGSGATETTTAGTPTTVAGPAPVQVSPTYKPIAVRWSYSSSKKIMTGTFKKVAGARTYGMTLSGATKKTVKCTTTKTTVTCRATLKKGQTLMTINARNSAKVIVAQRKASKTVK